ncbi:TIGR03086 family metal-binding protein [Saccharopolyspora mangrovi]|uniref:TIGR03086 family metal-binding protein n=1 Tax=Saccharopolyspora mangrovi TaxID=3082379 RepID=A0ABU6ALI0_9PSEU|nr:TIGR03086 family metal-binding protein [Saccharopolyspora sp. S2-29]MEB3372355.1 TIGR03086 family metal-binding protein [Saccharopolyspora sp. S2-29]
MIDLTPACRQMSDLLSVVTDDQLELPTPCAEFTVRGLIEHVDEAVQGFTTLASAAPGPGDVRSHVLELAEAWSSPRAWAGETAVAGVHLRNELWGNIALTEVVVHGWDLARATGRPFDLPDGTLRACLAHVRVFVPSAPLPELWGAPVSVVDDAPLVDQIVAVTGRVPGSAGRRAG